MCDHRQSSGRATAEDLAQFRVGDECPECQCTLAEDGHWYVELVEPEEE
jgi:hypothetical protein